MRFVVTPALMLLCLIGLADAASAGPNANAKILVHLLQPTGKTACTRSAATPGCQSVVTQGTVLPTAYFAHVLVADGNAAAGIGGLQFGISYNGAPGVGVDVYSWTLCATLEFIMPSSPPWPGAGGGTLITWDTTNRCQRFEPNGPATGVVANAGYFYLGAYTPDRFVITPRPVDSFAKVADCNAVEDIIQSVDFPHSPPPLGSAGFDRLSYNPCSEGSSSTNCSISGPSTVVTGTSGNGYNLGPLPGGWTTTLWTISGNGTIASQSGQSVTVTAGSVGYFTLNFDAVDATTSAHCMKIVRVEGPVPVTPTTWGGVKALYRS